MPLKPEEWIDEIDNALDYRYRFAKEEKWEDLESTYLNDADSDASIGENLIYSMGDSLISSLMNPDPEFVGLQNFCVRVHPTFHRHLRL